MASARGFTDRRLFGGIALAGLLTLAGLPLSAPLEAEEIASSIARGGVLYDKWWTVLKVKDGPATGHPSYPQDNKYFADGGEDWRCKNCHGWDYMGKDGAYGSGSHMTGIIGIRGKAGADPSEIVEILTNETHAYTDDMLGEEDVLDLARFVANGQVDMDEFIDRETKQIKGGDASRGEPFFNTVCAHCHGKDGKGIKDGEPLGEVSNDNPWEALHKVRHGQPDEQMPSMLLFDNQILLDILAYAQTLPHE